MWMLSSDGNTLFNTTTGNSFQIYQLSIYFYGGSLSAIEIKRGHDTANLQDYLIDLRDVLNEN